MTERLNHPAWLPRIAKLASIITKPMKTVAIQAAASLDFDWDYTLTLNVLAAGEDHHAFISTGNVWRRVRTFKADAHAETTKPSAAEREFGNGVCRHCGAVFAKTGPAHRYCRKRCKYAHERQRAKEVA